MLPSPPVPALTPSPQLCLPLPRPEYTIFPGRRVTNPGHYSTLVPVKRKSKSGGNYYNPRSTRSKSPKVRKRAARIKPLPNTPAAHELKDLISRVGTAITHAMLIKHGVAKQKAKCGRKQVYFPGLPMAEVAALVALLPESLRRTLLGHTLASTRTLSVLSDLTGMRMEQFVRLYQLRQQVDQDIQDVWKRRSLLIREGLKNRMSMLHHTGGPGWLRNPLNNPALRYKVESEVEKVAEGG